MGKTTDRFLPFPVSDRKLTGTLKRQFRYILAGVLTLALAVSLLFSMTRFFEQITYDAML